MAPYYDSWPALFEKNAAQLRDVLGDIAEGIEHIGSTAVPGLAAKPIIDIQVSVQSLESVLPYVEEIRQLGFDFPPHMETSRGLAVVRRIPSSCTTRGACGGSAK